MIHRLALLLLVATLALVPLRAHADDLVSAMSSHLVAITTSFSGSKVLLFGTIQDTGDIVVVLRGPINAEVVRRQGRHFGIWVNDSEMVFDDVPSVYGLAASGDLATLLPDRVEGRLQIGVDHLRLIPRTRHAAPDAVAAFRAALIRNKQAAGLYVVNPGQVTFIGDRLFRTDMKIPANAPVGVYTVTVFLVRDGEVVSGESSPLVVDRVGFEARIFEFAHRHGLLYGILAVVIAAVAGWGANLVFRKN